MPQVRLTRLLAWLNKSPIKDTDNALYQTIKELVKEMQTLLENLTVSVSSGGSGSDISDATFLTDTSEVAELPNSRRVLAGNYIHFNDAVASQRTISGEEWSVLTDGDLIAPELIFAGGDVIMTHVPG